MAKLQAHLSIACAFAASLLFLAASCKRSPSSALQGQTNVTMTFYGKAVDQDGAPLPNVAFEFRLEAYPKDWTFETRGRPYDVTTLNAVSDASGSFQLKLTGCILRMMKAEANGYRQLEALDGSTSGSDKSNSVFTQAIRLVSWGDQQYKSEVELPAIYVFVKDGAHQVTALPSQGGFRAYGKQWIRNEPGWPSRPSLPDVDWVDGQRRVNVDVPIVLKAVDADDRPLANATIYMDVVRYRSLKEMTARGASYDRTIRTSNEHLNATTGPDGLARVTLHGFRFGGISDVRIKDASYLDGPRPIMAAGHPNYYARELMDKAGNAIYRCDEQNPIVLVFVEKDAYDSRVMPSRGGYELRDGKWNRVEPSWPANPRPKVVYEPAATQPAP